ncbi:hypothetical protein ILYODFUR_026626, partial [Ilyodon furcidens]
LPVWSEGYEIGAGRLSSQDPPPPGCKVPAQVLMVNSNFLMKFDFEWPFKLRIECDHHQSDQSDHTQKENVDVAQQHIVYCSSWCWSSQVRWMTSVSYLLIAWRST